jgi:hypothetical protein
MPKSTSRRTSLQPVFEPFDLLESSPLMMPSILTSPPANGFHSEAMDDEPSGSSNGHHGEKNGATVNGATVNGAVANGAAVNGAVISDAVANGSDVNGLNGLMANGRASDDFAAHSEAASNGAVNVSAPVALNGAANHASNRIAATAEIDSDLVDAAVAREVFRAPASNAISSSPIPSHDVASASDAASQNGHAHLNGDASLNGNVGLGYAEAHSTEVNGSEVNGSATLASNSSAEIVARVSVPSAPPVVEVAPPQSSVESTFSAPPSTAPAAAAREPHPASGSLFVPYLVTEIRELRELRQRRRSWWRRIFG